MIPPRGEGISFELLDVKSKTLVWNVVTREGGVSLGQIRWFPRWRKYSFFPKSDTVFEPTCLTDITSFLRYATNNRKKIREDVQRF